MFPQKSSLCIFDCPLPTSLSFPTFVLIRSFLFSFVLSPVIIHTHRSHCSSSPCHIVCSYHARPRHGVVRHTCTRHGVVCPLILLITKEGPWSIYHHNQKKKKTVLDTFDIEESISLLGMVRKATKHMASHREFSSGAVCRARKKVNEPSITA